MKLVQHLSPKRIYLGVFFPHGVPVELPKDFPQHEVGTLLSWGWSVVEETEPEPDQEPWVETESEPSAFDAEPAPQVTRSRRGRRS